MGGLPVSWDEVVVFVVCESTGLPLSYSGWDHFVSGEIHKAIIGIVLGVPISVVGATYHWWKPPIKEWIKRNADRWWPVAVLFALIYVCGPTITKRIGLPSLGGFLTPVVATTPTTVLQQTPSPEAKLKSWQHWQAQLGPKVIGLRQSLETDFGKYIERVKSDCGQAIRERRNAQKELQFATQNKYVKELGRMEERVRSTEEQEDNCIHWSTEFIDPLESQIDNLVQNAPK